MEESTVSDNDRGIPSLASKFAALPHEPDRSRQADIAQNEDRYANIIDGQRYPLLALLAKSVREDSALLFPRVLVAIMATTNRIPRSLFIKSGPEFDRYAWATFTRWAKRVINIAQMRMKIFGRERVDFEGACLFVVNHLSPSDIPVIIHALPRPAGFVVNKTMDSIPLMSYWIRTMRGVFVRQGDPKDEIAAFRTMIKRLKLGRSLILFPEGYIHQDPGLAEFKRGGIHAALFAGVPIVPVCLYGTQDVMRTGSLRIVPRRRVVVEFGEPVLPARLSRAERKDIERIIRDRMIAMKSVYENSPSGGPRFQASRF